MNLQRTRPVRKGICLSEPGGTRRGCKWGERTCGCLNQEFSRYPHKRGHQRQTKGVAVTVNCNGPRLTLTTLITYKPLWLTVELSTATPFVASTVCTATPEGLTSTSLYGTFKLDSATMDISCAPAGTEKPRLDVCPAETLPGWLIVVPGPVVGCVPVTEFCKQKVSTYTTPVRFLTSSLCAPGDRPPNCTLY